MSLKWKIRKFESLIVHEISKGHAKAGNLRCSRSKAILRPIEEWVYLSKAVLLGPQQNTNSFHHRHHHIWWLVEYSNFRYISSVQGIKGLKRVIEKIIANPPRIKTSFSLVWLKKRRGCSPQNNRVLWIDKMMTHCWQLITLILNLTFRWDSDKMIPNIFIFQINDSIRFTYQTKTSFFTTCTLLLRHKISSIPCLLLPVAAMLHRGLSEHQLL